MATTTRPPEEVVCLLSSDDDEDENNQDSAYNLIYESASTPLPPMPPPPLPASLAVLDLVTPTRPPTVESTRRVRKPLTPLNCAFLGMEEDDDEEEKLLVTRRSKVSAINPGKRESECENADVNEAWLPTAQETARESAPKKKSSTRCAHIFNEPYVECLEQLREKYKRGARVERVGQTVARALKSVREHPRPLRTRKDFLGLKFVGDFVLRHLEEIRNELMGARDVSQGEAFVSPLPPARSRKTALPLDATRPQPRKRARLEEDSELEQKDAEAARAAQQDFEANPSDWRLICLIDSRERSLQNQRWFFQNRLLRADVQVEDRALPVGDVAWIWRSSRHHGEYVCDAIVERKTVEDLAQSIKDGRYAEQKSRLEASGLSRRVYLVEGDPARQTGLPSCQSVRTSMWRTRSNGYWVEETLSSEATADFFIHLHRSIELQRRQTVVCLPNRRWEVFKRETSKRVESTVRGVFQRMLLQLPGCGADAALAITKAYPTPSHLARAYFYDKYLENLQDESNDVCCSQDQRKPLLDQVEWKRRFELLAELPVATGSGSRKLGKVLSRTVAKFVCLREYVSRSEEMIEEEEEEGGAVG